MWEFFSSFLSSSQFIPHGHCYLWQPSLVWLHVVSDAAIALAYYSIPVWLIYFIHKRRDIPFPWIFLLFGAFIVACGTTHIFEVWTLWHPIYWVSGTVKALTATVSLFTALELGPLMPKLLALPSSAQLETTNRELEQQILERQQAEAVLAKQAATLQKQAQLLDLAHDTILVRTLEGVITFWNHGAEEMYGWSKAEALSCNLQNLLQTKFPQPLATIEAMLLQEGRWEGELIHTKRDGSQVIAASRWALQRDENGNPIAVLEINNDISDRKQAELALQAAHNQLEIRVTERTAALAQANKELRLEIIERRCMEATLRESEQRFRATFEQAAVGIAHVGLDGRWLRVNQKLCSIVGYDRLELLNSTFQEITYPADLNADLERVQQVLAGIIPTFSMEKRYIRRDGSLIWVNLTVSLVREADRPKYFISVIEDISERRQAEAKLQESLKKLSDIQFALDQAAIVAATDQRGIITYVNDKFCELSQYTRSELLGKNHRLINSRYHDPTFFQELWSTISQGKVWQGEIKNRAKDGSYYWVYTTIVPFLNAQGQPFQYLAVRFDITNRKHIEDALRESQMRFRTLAEATSEGILIQDQGLIIDANQAFAKIFGYEVEEVIGLPVANFLTPESSALANSHIQMHDEAAFELTGVRKEGTTLPLEVRCRESTYQGRNVRISTIRDITDRKNSEEQIRTSLREKEVLLKEIHHRVKNNLQIISSLLSLQSQNLDEEAVLAVFRESQNRIESMALIHEKLYQSEDMARINASEYIYDLVSNLFYTYEINADAIALKINVDDIWLGLDTAIPCGLIINELVLNALKHAFPEGRTGEVCIRFGIKDAHHLILSVTDTGVGLPKDLDYQNTDSLGLQLVNALTRQIEGILEINDGDGVKFEIVFPHSSYLGQ
ncbi:MAG TPA: PAS domain S-box protein [Allocoleopsis sp.]